MEQNADKGAASAILSVFCKYLRIFLYFVNIYFSLSELKGVCILYFVNIYFTLSELKGSRATSVKGSMEFQKI